MTREIKLLLSEARLKAFHDFKEAVMEVRGAYPESVFPSNIRTQDCKNAKMARKVCDDILRVYGAKKEKEVVEIRVNPVTVYDPDSINFDASKPYVWEKYRGWEGKIVGEGLNGQEQAWKVRISGDRLNYCSAIVNKSDIEIL